MRIRCDLPTEPPASVRAATRFVISEAVTNAAEHSGALRVDVELVTVDGRLRAKHVASIFGKLGITETAGYSRRVLAVLRNLGS